MSEDAAPKEEKITNYKGPKQKNRSGKTIGEEPVVKPPKNITPVVEGKVVQKKRGFWKKMVERFTGSDSRDVGTYVIEDIAIPAIKSMLSDMVSNGVERLLFGEVRARGNRDRRPRNWSSYDSMYSRRDPDPRDRRDERREISRQARRTHDFGEIVLESRGEAEMVIHHMVDLIDDYEQASVGDLYELLNIETSSVDEKWGWTDFSDARAIPHRGGYLLSLPKTEPLE